MLTNQRILQPKRDGQSLTVRGSARRHAVAVDFNLQRPVHHHVHSDSHPDSAPMCGIEQRTSQTARSIGKPQGLRGIFEQSNTNSRGVNAGSPTHRAIDGDLQSPSGSPSPLHSTA